MSTTRHPTFATHLDRCIYKTIRGRTTKNPQTLSNIIFGVDGAERLVLTHEELAGGLRRLIDAGHIVEISRHEFCDPSAKNRPRTFSGMTKSEHAAAVEDYRKRFRQLLADRPDESSDDEFVWQKLVLRWATPDDRWPTDEDEDAAESLAERIEPIIARSGLGEVTGYEYGSGHIDVLIFGRATDADVDQIYHLLAPPFLAHGCPPGSRIIRFYNERSEELESDVMP